MNDKYRIDSHKLIFHPKRVAEWLESRNNWNLSQKIYPIYVEVSPVGFCNHRCTFCALDFMEYQNRKLDYEILKKRISEMAVLGVKSIMFAGEGEPTLYKELPEIIEHCDAVGIDTALTTNFVPLTEKGMNTFIKYCKWIKVSINGGTPENYSKIHRTPERDFFKAIDNMKKCVEFRKNNNYKCTIGAQLLLVNDNYHTVLNLAETLQETGIDYLVIKPYSQHLESHTKIYENMDYSKYIDLKEKLEKYKTKNFNVIFRINTMNKLIEHRERYSKCCSVPYFWAYIMSDGSVYGCSAFLTNNNFNFGNIHKNTFKEIWESDARKNCINYLENLNINKCRINCRMDEINNYLWELTHPSEHVNFI